MRECENCVELERALRLMRCIGNDIHRLGFIHWNTVSSIQGYCELDTSPQDPGDHEAKRLERFRAYLDRMEQIKRARPKEAEDE